MTQNGRGIQGPGTVPAGEPIVVGVEGDDIDSVLVTDGQPGSKPTSVPVPPGGKVTIPARPGWGPGTVLFVYTKSVPVKGVIIEIVPPQE